MNGRGANDMKSGVCAMVFALDALRTAGVPAGGRCLRADGNGGGEHRQRRALDAGARLPRRRLPDPGADRGQDPARHRRRHVVPPAHLAAGPCTSSESERGTNAILSAFGLIEALRGHTRELNERVKSHPWFSRIPNPIKFNPGKIAGGDWASSTPAWCEVDCRIAVLPGMSLADFREELTGVVMAAARQDPFLADNPPEIDLERLPGRRLRAGAGQRVRGRRARRPPAQSHGSEPGEIDPARRHRLPLLRPLLRHPEPLLRRHRLRQPRLRRRCRARQRPTGDEGRLPASSQTGAGRKRSNFSQSARPAAQSANAYAIATSSSRLNRPDDPPWPAPMLVRSSTGPPDVMVARSRAIHFAGSQ